MNRYVQPARHSDITIATCLIVGLLLGTIILLVVQLHAAHAENDRLMLEVRQTQDSIDMLGCR